MSAAAIRRGELCAELAGAAEALGEREGGPGDVPAVRRHWSEAAQPEHPWWAVLRQARAANALVKAGRAASTSSG